MREEHSTTPVRAGRYVAQPAGYRAFIPSPLPPDPPIRIAGQLQALLSRADRALGRLDGSIQTLPNPDLFIFSAGSHPHDLERGYPRPFLERALA